MSKPLPFIRYGRLSRLNGRTPGDNVSRAMQDRDTSRIAKANDLPVLPEFFFDEDMTGTNFDRPEWERAIALVDAGKAGGIIAFDLKRMTRGKTGEVLAMVEDVEESGGQLYDQSGPISVASADAEMVTTLKAMFGRREIREKKSYLEKGVAQAIDRGIHLQAPYGYRKSDTPSSPLVIEPREAPVVQRAFELRASGHSWSAIANALNEAGTTPRPYKRTVEGREAWHQAKWQHKTVRQVVQNRVYLGIAYNGEQETPNAHPAIISAALFAKANGTKGTRYAQPTEGYLLTGLVRCAGCGYVMIHAAEKGGRYYRCRPAQHGNGPCPAPVNVPAELLEDYVWGEFCHGYLGGEARAEDAYDERVQAAQDELARWTAKLEGVYALAATASGMSATEQRIHAAHAQEARLGIVQAEAELARAQTAARGLDLPAALTRTVADAASLSDRRHWVSLVFRCVVVRRAVAESGSTAREASRNMAARSRILLLDEAPTDSLALIPFVAGLGPDLD